MTRHNGQRKIPPHSVEAEMVLLGSLIVCGVESPDRAKEAMSKLRDAGDFYLPHHGDIYRAIRACYQRSGSVDAVRLVERIKRDGVYGSVGGSRDAAEYLTELVESVPTGSAAPHYAEIVADKARRRRFLSWVDSVERQIHDPNADPIETARRARRMLDRVTGQPPQ